MTHKGSARNQQKSNERRKAEAKRREAEARDLIQRLKSLRAGERGDDFVNLLEKQEGILKKALTAQRDSETHSRKEKGGRR